MGLMSPKKIFLNFLIRPFSRMYYRALLGKVLKQPSDGRGVRPGALPGSSRQDGSLRRTEKISAAKDVKEGY